KGRTAGEGWGAGGRVGIWRRLRRGVFRRRRVGGVAAVGGEGWGVGAAGGGFGAAGGADLPAEQDCVHRAQLSRSCGGEQDGDSERAGDFFQGDDVAGGSE